MENEIYNPSEIHNPSRIWDEVEPSVPVSTEKYFRQTLPDITESTQFRGGSRKSGGYRLIAWSVASALIDSFLLAGISCFVVLAFALIVRAKLNLILGGLSLTSMPFLIGLEIVFAFSYMICLRTFMGHSIGEWACGLRLGTIEQRLHKFYAFKVLSRTLIIFLTGVVTLPLLSLLIGKDIPGKICGLQLMEKQA